jgi:hypothetical protein
MYDAVSIYHVMKAEQQAMLAELAELERKRNYPRANSTRAPRRPAFGRWVARLQPSTTPDPAANAAG